MVMGCNTCVSVRIHVACTKAPLPLIELSCCTGVICVLLVRMFIIIGTIRSNRISSKMLFLLL